MSANYPTEQEARLAEKLTRFGRNIKAKLVWIAALTLACGSVAALYSFFLFQEVYQSSATILLNPVALDGVAGHFVPSEKASLMHRDQETLLKSRLLLSRVMEKAAQQKIRLPQEATSSLIGSTFQALRLPNTNFIGLKAQANQPVMAQRLATLYLDAYLDLLHELSNEPFTQKRQLLESQLKQAETTLAEMYRQIEKAQSNQKLADTGRARPNQDPQLQSLATQRRKTEANLAQKRAEAARLRKQLGPNLNGGDKALCSVANGQNEALTRLKQKLMDAQQDYDLKALIYAPTNPEMIQLRHRLEGLKAQVVDQQIVPVGHNPASKNHSVSVSDSTRADLVQQLALADAESAALQNRLNALQTQYRSFQAVVKKSPEQATELTRLMFEKKGQEENLARLKRDLAEVQSHEAGVSKRLRVIDRPGLPQKPVTPLKWQIIAGAAAVGLLLGFSVVALQTAVAQDGLTFRFIERTLNAPVLGCIPWFSDEKWRYLRQRGRLEMLASDVAPAVVSAYQDLALNLKAQRNALNKNAVVFSPLNESRDPAFILANLGFCLAQGGDRVLLIDADLHHPGLHEAFNHPLDYEQGLPELINSVSELLHRKKDTQVQDILDLAHSVATPSGIHPQLQYLNAGLAMENTFEFLNSKSVDVLLNVLKAGYDWVLISVPPLLKRPDCSILLGYADGLLLLTDPKSRGADILAAQRKVERIGTMTYGVIQQNRMEL